MWRYYLPLVVELALLVYCLIDCIQTDSVLVRNLNKTLWVFLIVLVPVVGPVAWLVAGRPHRAAQAPPRVPWPSTATAGFPEYERPKPPPRGGAPRGPDDDPEFLAGLAVPADDPGHARMLGDWERQLREREERLRAAEAGRDVAPDGPLPDGAQEPDAGAR